MRRSTLKKIGLSAVIAIGATVGIVYTSSGSTEAYRMVDKLMPEASRWVGKDLRVHGWVEAGSIKQAVEGQVTRTRFVLIRGGKRIDVTHVGPTPDTFRDGSEVVASGTLNRAPGAEAADASYLFEARVIMAKCPSKYEGAPSNKPTNTLDGGPAPQVFTP